MLSVGYLGWKGSSTGGEGSGTLVTLRPGVSVNQPPIPGQAPGLCPHSLSVCQGPGLPRAGGGPCLPARWSVCPVTLRAGIAAAGSQLEGRLASVPLQKRNGPACFVLSSFLGSYVCSLGQLGGRNGCGACLQLLWPRPLPPRFRVGRDARGEQGWAR